MYVLGRQGTRLTLSASNAPSTSYNVTSTSMPKKKHTSLSHEDHVTPTGVSSIPPRLPPPAPLNPQPASSRALVASASGSDTHQPKICSSFSSSHTGHTPHVTCGNDKVKQDRSGGLSKEERISTFRDGGCVSVIGRCDHIELHKRNMTMPPDGSGIVSAALASISQPFSASSAHCHPLPPGQPTCSRSVSSSEATSRSCLDSSPPMVIYVCAL